jgi:hypothetical protein
MINPNDLIIINRNGSNTIAETVYPSAEAGRYSLKYLRIYYSAGTTSADITLSVDHRLGSTFDFELFTIGNAGGGGSQVNMPIATDELSEWTFDVFSMTPGERDGLKIAQTLTSADTWALEAAFINAEAMG